MGIQHLPNIDLARCTACGLCVKHCPVQAVALIDGLPVITRPQACTYCGLCEEFCPPGAINLSYEIVMVSPRRDRL